MSLNLSQRADGGWIGDLDQGGTRREVRLMRDEPLLAVAPVFGADGVVSPYRTAPRPAAARAPVAKKAPVTRRAVRRR